MTSKLAPLEDAVKAESVLAAYEKYLNEWLDAHPARLAGRPERIEAMRLALSQQEPGGGMTGRLTNIRHVRQEHPYGCVVASLAMLSGMTYAEVLAEYPWIAEKDGCDIDTISYDFLWRHGFAYQQVYSSVPEINRDPRGDMTERRAKFGRKPWPPEPWAPAHLCQVLTSMTHAVVMLADGTVLDPIDPTPRRLSDYSHVSNVRGIWDVSSASEITRRALASGADADEYRDALHELLMCRSEQLAIGGGPGWKERNAKAWQVAADLIGPDEERSYYDQ